LSKRRTKILVLIGRVKKWCRATKKKLKSHLEKKTKMGVKKWCRATKRKFKMKPFRTRTLIWRLRPTRPSQLADKSWKLPLIFNQCPCDTMETRLSSTHKLGRNMVSDEKRSGHGACRYARVMIDELKLNKTLFSLWKFLVYPL